MRSGHGVLALLALAAACGGQGKDSNWLTYPGAAGQCDTIHAGKVSGYAWASPSCYGCHRDGLGITPQDHQARFFPMGDGTPHPAVCTTCHTDPPAGTPA